MNNYESIMILGRVSRWSNENVIVYCFNYENPEEHHLDLIIATEEER